jgi:predicted O-methyltransferase YrrM
METYEDFYNYINTNIFQLESEKLNTEKANLENYSKYSKFNSIKDLNGNLIKPPNNTQIESEDGIIDYLINCGFLKSDLKYIDSNTQRQYLLKIVNSDKNYILNSLEFNFNTGLLASYFLKISNSTLISFDNNFGHKYSFYAKEFIDYVYPNRHLLIEGNINIAQKTFLKLKLSKPIDLIFSDFDFDFENKYKNFLNKLENGPIIVKNQNDENIHQSRLFNHININKSDPLATLKYIVSNGYRYNQIEGGTGIEQMKVHKKIFDLFKNKTGRYPKKVAEIGFNAGVSAYTYLNMLKSYNEDFLMVSFDLGMHDYCVYAKHFIDTLYPEKHLLINGSSLTSVKLFNKLFNDEKFDIIFIDGDHTFSGAYQDIFNCKLLSNKDTLVLIDNVAPHRGVGREVYLSILELIKSKTINHLEHYEIDIIPNKNIKGEKYHDGMSLVSYVFDDSQFINLDLIKIERKVISYSIDKILKNDLDLDSFKFVYRSILKNYNLISNYVTDRINKVHIPYYENKFNIRIKKIMYKKFDVE